MLKAIATKTSFNKAFLVLSLFVFIVVAVRAWLVPFAHDEGTTFFDYIEISDFLPYTSHPDANNHILNSFLGWISFHLFGDSCFALRLPNIVSLCILIFAVYRLTKRLEHKSAKAFLIAGLLLSFHWLSFFSMCRGYGISMAFGTLALSYIPDYIESKNYSSILKIFILLDLALSANLSLMLAVLIITGLICLFQLYHHRFFKIKNSIVLFIHAAIILYWAKYSFFLQDNNFLYAGGGTSYWRITFVSLIYAIVGKQNAWINSSIVCIYCAMIVTWLYFFIKSVKKPQSNYTIYTLFLVILLNAFIFGIYVVKKICGINFYEDRAALMFYLLFILIAAFVIDTLKPRIANFIASAGFLLFSLHFAWNLNFHKHSLDMYNVMPERFYDRLVQEQKQNPEVITIEGSKFRELLYSFMNYRHNGELNAMDVSIDPVDMFMNADYAIEFSKDRGKYSPYYSEIDSEEDYGFVLLKRKQPLTRNLVFTVGKREAVISKTNEYYNFFEIKDTVFDKPSPLLVEVNFKVQSGDMPLSSWLVLSVDSAEGKTVYYQRLPLNLIKYNWLDTGKNEDLILEMGCLPSKVHRLVCYLWNFKKQRITMTINSVKLFQLEGYGSNVYARVKSHYWKEI